MEKSPVHHEMSLDQIRTEIAAEERVLAGLKEQIGRHHEETGSNSLDDEGTEAELDQQASDLLAFNIGEKKRRIAELRLMLEQSDIGKAA